MLLNKRTGFIYPLLGILWLFSTSSTMAAPVVKGFFDSQQVFDISGHYSMDLNEIDHEDDVYLDDFSSCQINYFNYGVKYSQPLFKIKHENDDFEYRPHLRHPSFTVSLTKKIFPESIV